MSLAYLGKDEKPQWFFGVKMKRNKAIAAEQEGEDAINLLRELDEKQSQQ